jgi:hypothetical protein
MEKTTNLSYTKALSSFSSFVLLEFPAKKTSKKGIQNEKATKKTEEKTSLES